MDKLIGVLLVLGIIAYLVYIFWPLLLALALGFVAYKLIKSNQAKREIERQRQADRDAEIRRKWEEQERADKQQRAEDQANQERAAEVNFVNEAIGELRTALRASARDPGSAEDAGGWQRPSYMM